MMINKKNCSLIVLLVLVALPRSSKSIFQRLTKRSTDDGACEKSTAKFCSHIINHENRLTQRFGPDTSQQIQNHYRNASANCKVLLCVMTMYAVMVEGEKYFPNSPFINDEAFVNVIKGSSLAECNDNKNNYNANNDSRIEDAYTTATNTIDDKSYTTDGSSNINTDFNQFETTSTQQDTQSIKSNEIDGSVNESKHEPRKGIIDILYTNENYTNAAKSQNVNEKTDTELFENNHGIGTESVVNLDNRETSTSDSTPQFIYNNGDDERSELDVANKIGTTTDTNTVPTSDFVFVTSFITSTPIPIISTDIQVEGIATNSGSYQSKSGGTDDETKRVLTWEASAMPSTNQSTLSQVRNVIYQLLGEEGYSTFSCNFTTDATTTDDNNHSTNYYDMTSMYRRTNKLLPRNEKANDTHEHRKFQPSVDRATLLEIPERLRADQQIQLLLLEFNIFELCNFTSNGHDNRNEIISKQLALCSNGISKLKSQVTDGEARKILDKYSQDIFVAMNKYRVTHESKMKIIKIINLTDYLLSTIKESQIPSGLKSNFLELKQFLLEELKNEDLSSFHPDSNRKDVFMVQLFDYLLQSKIVDNNKKKLLELFKKFIRNVS